MTPAEDLLVQYGAVGAIALIALYVARVLFGKLNETLTRERERADRLEAELAKLNETVRSEYIGTLAKATDAIADALSAVRRG
jgi:tRNA(Phe) wybutosine-synthesizing methylase Tyw3